MASAPPQDTPQWWEAFPAPKATCPRVEITEVETLVESAVKNPGLSREYLLVDVRRTDFEGGTIATSINLPAQSFYPTRPTVHQLCKQAGIRRVIFYCGSCGTRGPRSANWMQDYFDQVGETEIKAEIMTGGIKGWQKAFNGRLMDAYEEKYWSGQGK